MDFSHLPFLRDTLIGSFLIGTLCAYLGIYIVLRRIVFVSAALAQLSSLGVAIALLMGWAPFPAALALTMAGVVFFALQKAGRRLPQESVIGYGYIFASALTVLLVAKSPSGEADMLTILFGNILTLTTRDIIPIAAVFAVLWILHFMFAKEFLLVSFDREMAEAAGMRVILWELFLYATIGVAISLAIRGAGAMLVFAYLVVPAMTALVLTDRLRVAVVLALGASVGATGAGVFTSVMWDLPTGATIASVLCLLLMVAAVARWRAL